MIANFYAVLAVICLALCVYQLAWAYLPIKKRDR